MKTPDEILRFIALWIGYVYERPLMYGGTGAGVDLLLHTYHKVWSEVLERYADFETTWGKVLDEEECGSFNFSHRFQMNHPGASEQEIATYVVQQWRKVSDRLGVPISPAHEKHGEPSKEAN